MSDSLFDKRLQDIISAASKNNSYADLLRYLTARDAVPEVTVGYAGGNSGEFRKGPGLPPKGVVEIGYEASRSAPHAAGILTHEMTHAADTAMYNQFNQRRLEMGAGPTNVPWGQNQFMDGFRKLAYDFENGQGAPRLQAASYMAPEWVKANAGYRASPSELPAHAVGNFATGGAVPKPGPSHVDASAAQDFMVLLDLAQRDAAKGKQTPAPGIVEYFKSLFK